LPPVLPVRRPFTNDVHGELPLPTQCRRLAKPPVMSPEGHLEALPPPRLNAGYQFSNPTFAGAAVTNGNAP
jgi:hypothetical protein